MDRRKEFKCGCLILTLLSLVVLVQPDVIPALPPEPDCDSLPNCYGSIPALHNAIVRILANNQEYGSGIHSLHKLYNQLHKDFVNMKDQINSLEKKFVLEKLKQTNNKQTTRVPQPTLKPLPEPELQVHGHVDYTVAGSLEEVLKDNHIWTSDEFNSFQTLFINMTTNLRAQNHKTSKLLKRVNNYRKDVKKYAHLARRFDKKLLHFVDKGSFEESFRKQKSINSLLESRLSQLERLLNRPDVAFQMDGTHKRSHSHQGCPPDFRDYMSSCYHFSNKTLNWIDAEKHCQQMHHQAHLVAVESAMENDYILQYRLFNAVNWSSDFIWLGGLDISGAGKWTWAGTQRPVSFSLWQNGAQYQTEDNNIHHQDCVYTQTLAHSLWSKWNCFNARLNFVCEIHLSDTNLPHKKEIGKQ